MQIKSKPSYAPFGSVSRKKEVKKKKGNDDPGPGSYDICLPLITPVVQTIRKPNNNIIVKLGHIGTSSFLGSQERFKQQSIVRELGPGQYEKDQKNHSSEKHSHRKSERLSAANRLKQLIPQTYEHSPTISQIKRVEFDDQIEMPAKQNVLKKRNIYKGGDQSSLWSRLTEKRTSPSPKQINQLGPGSYDVEHGQKMAKGLHHSSPFASESARSYLDKIVFGTNHDEKARERQKNQYKSGIIGPGSYNLEQENKNKIYKYQFFGSTEERL